MKPTIFFPIIDNGQGYVKRNFQLCLRAVDALGKYDIYTPAFSDSLTPRARNRAAAAFLRGKRDQLLFVDTDIVFTTEHFEMIMQHPENVVGGIYCKKEQEVSPCYNLLENTAPQKVGGLVEIKRTGTGFLRIDREVLIRMKETPAAKCQHCGSIHWTQAAFYKNHGDDEWDFFPTGVKDLEYLSEDWFFCDRARALGFKVWCDTRIQTKHEGTCFYPTDDAVKRQAEREKAMAANSNLDMPVPVKVEPTADTSLEFPTSLERNAPVTLDK